MKALNKGNILGVRKYQEGGASPVSQMPMRQAQQIEMPTSNKGLVSSSFGGYKPQNLDDLTTSQLWEQVTGTPWSEAAKRGHTSGKFNDREQNMALRQVLTGSDPRRITLASVNRCFTGANFFGVPFGVPSK